mgnify:CR=1 FL=1
MLRSQVSGFIIIQALTMTMPKYCFGKSKLLITQKLKMSEYCFGKTGAKQALGWFPVQPSVFFIFFVMENSMASKTYVYMSH